MFGALMVSKTIKKIKSRHVDDIACYVEKKEEDVTKATDDCRHVVLNRESNRTSVRVPLFNMISP